MTEVVDIKSVKAGSEVSVPSKILLVDTFMQAVRKISQQSAMEFKRKLVLWNWIKELDEKRLSVQEVLRGVDKSFNEQMADESSDKEAIITARNKAFDEAYETEISITTPKLLPAEVQELTVGELGLVAPFLKD